jgi:sulfopyruvate decarboxylase subunit beta
MTDNDVIRSLFTANSNDLYVVANGYLSRRAFEFRNATTAFYMIGSMGLALSIGLGVAITQPSRRVVVVDGDGNLMMSLGTLVMVGNVSPKNLIHIVIDNEQYASTGGQRSVSGSVDLSSCALASSYRSAVDVRDVNSLETAMEKAKNCAGPAFVRARVTAAHDVGPRVCHSPEVIAHRFRLAIFELSLNRET